MQRAALAIALFTSAGCANDSPTATSPVTTAPPASVAGSSAAGASGASATPPIAGSAGSAPVGVAGSTPAPSGGSGGASTSGSSGVGGASMQPTGGMGGAGGMGPVAGAAGTSAGTPDCVKGSVTASEVVFIGESFIALSGAIPRFTSQLARDAGTIGATESYRSYAVSGTQLTTGEIPAQYTQAQDAGPVKVVLMDGGGNDLLIGGRCQGSFDAGCKEIVGVVQTLFATMKAGGVQDVLYFFYPDPMGIGANIKDAMDILRPEMKKACDGATDLHCVWVDQRESWESKYSMYTEDGIHPTDAGSMASAKQIWDAMVASCIAQ